jgi:NMD protein affecting ribosome stability and mRNA decay
MSATATAVMICSRCGNYARAHATGLCHDCRQAKAARSQRRHDAAHRRELAFERAARFAYEYDRDF